MLRALYKFKDVITRERMKHVSRTIFTERLLDCLPSTSQFCFHEDASVDSMSDTLVLHEKSLHCLFGEMQVSELNPNKDHTMLIRSAYLFSEETQVETSVWPVSGCSIVLPPSVACTVIKTRDDKSLHMTGVGTRYRGAIIGTLGLPQDNFDCFH